MQPPGLKEGFGMRLLRNGLVLGALLVAGTQVGLAQAPSGPPVPAPTAGAPMEVPAPSPGLPSITATEDIHFVLAQANAAGKEQATLQAGAQQDDKKRIDLLIKQNETLEKMVRLLAKQVEKLEKQPSATPSIENLQ
jgi:hypothetical protein